VPVRCLAPFGHEDVFLLTSCLDIRPRFRFKGRCAETDLIGFADGVLHQPGLREMMVTSSEAGLEHVGPGETVEEVASPVVYPVGDRRIRLFAWGARIRVCLNLGRRTGKTRSVQEA